MQEGFREDVNPELLEQSSVYRELVNGAESVMEFGISPGTAALIVAAVPITLKLLRMVNEWFSASVDDWAAGKRIDRKKQEAEADREIEAKAVAQKIRLRKQLRDAGVAPPSRPAVNLSYDEEEIFDPDVDIIEG